MIDHFINPLSLIKINIALKEPCKIMEAIIL